MKTQKCLYCNKKFEVRESEIKRGFGKFCSRNCGASFNGQLIKAALAKNVTCALCGKRFHKTKSTIKKSKSKLFFCCREHKDQAQRLEGIKEIHPPHYNTGKNSYRKRALRTYQHKCEICNYSEEVKILEVHHIDSNRSNNKIENLIILCPNHHRMLTLGIHTLVNRKLK